MTELLEKAIKTVRDWPAERQDEAAKLLFALGELGDPYAANADELAAIDEALEEVRRGERASTEDVEAAFARFKS